MAAQADNGICGVGVSFNASIGGKDHLIIFHFYVVLYRIDFLSSSVELSIFSVNGVFLRSRKKKIRKKKEKEEEGEVLLN